jgi:hypothetical protein
MTTINIDLYESLKAENAALAARNKELEAALENALRNEGQDACCLPLGIDPCHCWRCQARRAIAKGAS